MLARFRLGPARRVQILVAFAALFCIFRVLGGGRPHSILEDDPARWLARVASEGEGANDDLCRHLGWKPFRSDTPAVRRKVYDLFMINTELDWLEIRLNTTYDYVDYFIMVESPMTFTGWPKPLTIKDNLSRFARYQDKIIYHELALPPNFQPKLTWDIEDLQRNAMFDQVFPALTGAQAPHPGDAIVVADVDEIVRPLALAALRACTFPRRLTLRSRFYYYAFEFAHHGAQWPHPQATTYGGASSTVRPAELRSRLGWVRRLWHRRDVDDLWNAGWHCSSCFATIDELLTKMASFSHTTLNEKRFRDRDRIAERVRAGRDLWDRKGEAYDRIENNVDVPPLLLVEKQRFRYLTDRSGPTAGFQDYPP